MGLLDIPAEVRGEILKELFLDSQVNILHKCGGPSGRCRATCQRTTSHDILYTCKQLYAEARPVLAFQLTLRFDGTKIEDVPEATRTYYFPLIRRIIIDCSDFPQVEKLKDCSALEEVQFVPDKDDLFNRHLIEPELSPDAAIDFVNGAIDNKLAREGRETIMELDDNDEWKRWQKQILKLSANGSAFKVIGHASFIWCQHQDYEEDEGELVSSYNIIFQNGMAFI